jgi:hypothetical protein
MEMPMDVLNKRLGQIRDNGDIDFDNTMAAVDIDSELQEKFIFIPQEEIDAVEIKDSKDGHGFYAGSGPEVIQAGEHDNPAWLYNSAVHALALWWKMTQDARKDETRAALRPAPGVYELWTGGERLTAIVTADRRIICPTHGNSVMSDFTDIFDGLETKTAWVFTPIETGLSA